MGQSISKDQDDYTKPCMDCGGVANCSTTHDNVPRCEYCEKCYTDEKEETEYWMCSTRRKRQGFY